MWGVYGFRTLDDAVMIALDEGRLLLILWCKRWGKSLNITFQEKGEGLG